MGSAHQTGAGNNIPEPLYYSVQIGAVIGAQRHRALCQGRDYIVRAAAVGDCIVHPGVLANMFPHVFDSLEGKHQTVQSAAALLWGHGCVGAAAVETDLEAGQGKTFDVSGGSLSGMEHQSNVQFLKAAVFLHHDFAANTLLSRCTIYRDGEGLVVCHILQSQCGAKNSRTLGVMAAAVAQIRQGVILAKQAEVGAAGTVGPGGAESGFQAAHPLLHAEACPFQEGGKYFAGVVLPAA